MSGFGLGVASMMDITISINFRKIVILLGIFALFSRAALAEPAMWVIRDGDSTIYLVGTVHLLRHETEWNSAKIKKALADSTELWLEMVDGDDPTKIQSLLVRYGVDRNKRLSDKLNFAEKARLSKLAADYGVPLENMENLKPWAVAMMFAVLPLEKGGFDPGAGVDQVLKNAAVEKGEPVKAFETAETQVRFFANMTEADQLAFLDDTLDDTERGLDLLNKVAEAWLKGDSKTISDMMNDEMKNKAPTLYQTLLVRRNARWSEKIEEILKGSGTQMIAVGAAHLVGSDSVQAQLAERGIKAESY